MKKTIKILGVLFAVIVILLVLTVVLVNRYLQSPEFKEFALGAAHDALGSNVKLDTMNISVFSGVTLTGVVVSNPQGFPGDLLTADAFVLHYRLLPLLRRRVEIEEVSLRKPGIKLVRGDSGKWNYESFTAKAEQAATSNAAASTASEPTPTVRRGHFDITLSKVALDNGDIVMLAQTNKELLHLQGINLTSSIGFTGDKLSGDGKAGIDAINLSNSLFINKLAAVVKLSGDSLELDSLKGELAGGQISGNVSAKVLGDLNYAVQLQVKDADVDKLLQDAKTKRVMKGKLQATVALQGTGGLPTIAGSGQAQITGGELVNEPILNTLAFVLPELKDLHFTEFRLEFSISNNVVQTPVIHVISPDVQITGTGTVSLADNTLNENMTLALSSALMSHVPQAMQGAFSQRSDGFMTVDFRVWGPYSSPQNDLKNKLITGTAKGLLQQGLERLLTH